MDELSNKYWALNYACIADAEKEIEKVINHNADSLDKLLMVEHMLMMTITTTICDIRLKHGINTRRAE